VSGELQAVWQKLRRAEVYSLNASLGLASRDERVMAAVPLTAISDVVGRRCCLVPGAGSAKRIAGSRPRWDPIRQCGVGAIYLFGGLIMMCAPAVPGNISHGALSLGLVDSPVDSGVAKGT
jgi:hypothetical protein